MKKNFLLLCGLLLGVCGFVACSDDETTPAPEPTFPELVTKTAEAGKVIDLSFSANYDWTATISEDTYTYFQLLSGETAVNTLSGVAGEHTIKVQVSDDVVYENAPVAEVTLTMNGISQVIAKITYPTTARETAVYAPMLNQYSGAFQGGAYGGELLYSYNETAMTADDVVAMQWGTERGNNDGEDTFFAPVLVTTNFAYTLAGPAWMVAAEEGAAGTTEYVIKADATQIPAESETATIDVLAGEEVIASFKVAITGADDYIKLSQYIDESYAYQSSGEPVDMYGGFETDVTVATPNIVVVDATGAVVDWVTINATTEDDETIVIKSYMLTATVAENTTDSPRKAYAFCFPNANVSDYTTLFDAEGAVKEEYEANYITTFAQYPEPGTIESVEVDVYASFGEPGENAGYAFSEYALRGFYFGDSKYELRYEGEWAADASQYTYLKAAGATIASFRTFCNTKSGSWAEITENRWVWGQLKSDTEDANDFQILVNKNAETMADAEILEYDQATWSYVGSGVFEAVILVEFTNGTCAAIYFTYTENEAKEEATGLKFQYADMGYPTPSMATLTELGMNDTLYWDYNTTYPGAKIYDLSYYTLDQQSMNAIIGLEGLTCEILPSFNDKVDNADWLSYDSESHVIFMNTLMVDGEMQYALQGAMIFKDENNVVKYVIVCTLFIDQSTDTEA